MRGALVHEEVCSNGDYTATTATATTTTTTAAATAKKYDYSSHTNLRTVQPHEKWCPTARIRCVRELGGGAQSSSMSSTALLRYWRVHLSQTHADVPISRIAEVLQRISVVHVVDDDDDDDVCGAGGGDTKQGPPCVGICCPCESHIYEAEIEFNMERLDDVIQTAPTEEEEEVGGCVVVDQWICQSTPLHHACAELSRFLSCVEIVSTT